MIRCILSTVEPFILTLLGTVALASLLPPRGIWVGIFEVAADIGVVLLFFLHGAKLSRQAVFDGVRNWRLHLAVFAATFLLFPILGLGIAALPLLPTALASGILFLTLLPSAVQSSIAFTAMARGNVAAAVCSASFSNLAGVVLTPLLVALLMHVDGNSGVSIEAIEKVLLQLLLPFIVGHLLRSWIGGWLSGHKKLVTLVDRGSILLIVYTAFGTAVVAGLWSQVSATDLALLVLVCVVLLAVVLGATWSMAKAMKLPCEDAIVLLFCGSKKSLASGVPMAGVLFAPSQIGMILLPVMLFHQLQLVACAMIARRLAGGARGD